MSKRQIIATESAPAALGPYSQGVTFGDLVFTSGQVGIDPATGALAEGLEAQAHQVFKNLQAVLAAAGSALDNALKVTVFLADMGDFPALNAIYATYMPDPPPARSTIAVKQLPISALVEIEVIAHA